MIARRKEVRFVAFFPVRTVTPGGKDGYTRRNLDVGSIDPADVLD
jgi:hypothetical protein